MKNLIITTLLSAGILFVSCEKPFDLSSDGRITYDEIFSDYKLAGNYLNKAYTYMPTLGATSAGNNFIAVFSDEAHDAQSAVGCAALNYYDGKMTSNSNMLDDNFYYNMYQGIRTCNVFINRIGDVPNMTIEKHRSQWKGEAYLLRAFYYLQLIKRYGPVPIIKEELPIDYDYSQHERPSFYENVQAIIADCNLALAEPDLPWRVISDNENGCMTKSVAYAIKSQAILFAASPLWNDGVDRWDEAARITKVALDSLYDGGYRLFNPASSTMKAYSNYQRFFLTKPEQVANPANDKETIYAQKGQIGAIWQQHGLPMMPDVVKAGATPSQELVDAYETIDGVPVLNPEQPYLDADHLQPNYNPANTKYNKNNPYANRDPRLFSTVYCNGNFHNLNNNTQPVWTFVGGNCGISENNNLNTPTGYYLRKFVNHTSKKNANADGYWRYFRLAEMYLNYAEAEFYANGMTPEAVNAVNEIRLRAGLPVLPSDMTPAEFEQRLRNERRVELAFEEHRYFDVRRWKLLDKTDGVVTGMKITKTSDSPVKYNYERVVVKKRFVTDAKYLLWPIPLTEATKYSMLGIEYQNPGWK